MIADMSASWRLLLNSIKLNFAELDFIKKRLRHKQQRKRRKMNRKKEKRGEKERRKNLFGLRVPSAEFSAAKLGL
jgi:hypothetical protein